MKFYRIKTEEGLVQFVGTQAVAKALKQPLIVEEVPVDKDGLLVYINDLNKRISYTPVELEVEREPSISTAIITKMDAPKAAASADLKIEDVTEFILDVESFKFSRIFEAFIERLDRLKRETNNASS